MAYYSVSPRGNKFCCQVRWYPTKDSKRKSKNKTFKNKASANAWGKLQVREIEQKIARGEDVYNLNSSIKTLGELIRTYLDDEHVSIGRSKRFSLEAITTFDIADTTLDELRPKHFVDFCKERKSGGASPATIACDISHIRAVLKTAKALYDVNVDETPIVKATPSLHALGLIGKSRIRTRRPTSEEVELILQAFAAREAHESTIIPYGDIFDFSILSCMRVGEVCSILWEDLNEQEEWVWIRDRKDPRKKIGNHMKVPLLGGALDIVKRQPMTDDPRIFPYSSKSVSSGFQRVVRELGIEDLRYHDLRREGASRLFEQGYSIDRVAQVTGHRDLNTLWRIYTDLHPNREKPH